MLAVDENLRHRLSAARPRQHLLALGTVFDHVDVLVGDPLAVEQALGTRAVAAEHRGIDLDARHGGPNPPLPMGQHLIKMTAESSGFDVTRASPANLIFAQRGKSSSDGERCFREDEIRRLINGCY